MKIRDRQLLINYMEDRDISGARLGRHAEVSREFIRALRIGRKTTCTPKVADRIEEALGLLKGTLFEDSKSPSGARIPPVNRVDSKSPDKRPTVKKQAAA